MNRARANPPAPCCRCASSRIRITSASRSASLSSSCFRKTGRADISGASRTSRPPFESGARTTWRRERVRPEPRVRRSSSSRRRSRGRSRCDSSAGVTGSPAPTASGRLSWRRALEARPGEGPSLLTRGERLSTIGSMPYPLQDVDKWMVDSLMIPASLHDVNGRFGHMNAAAERGEPTDFETVFIDGSGQLRGVRAQHLPLRSGGTIVGVLILAFDAPRQPSGPVGLEPQPRLTPRQREILDLIAAGLSTSEIAKQLTLSTETVRNHLRSLFRALNVHTRLEATAAARRLGLLAPRALGPQRRDPSAHTG